MPLYSFVGTQVVGAVSWTDLLIDFTDSFQSLEVMHMPSEKSKAAYTESHRSWIVQFFLYSLSCK